MKLILINLLDKSLIHNLLESNFAQEKLIDICVIPFEGYEDDEKAKNFIEYRLFLDEQPVDGFIIYFNFDQGNLQKFSNLAIRFFKMFGLTGIESLMILGVSNKLTQLSLNELVVNSDGYKFLNKENNGKNVSCVFWNDLLPNKQEIDLFKKTISQLEQYEEPEDKFKFRDENEAISFRRHNKRIKKCINNTEKDCSLQ